MSLLDKFSNPIWYKIEQLQDAPKQEVCFVITLPGCFRLSIDEMLVAPLERLGKKVTPLTSETRERLIDEALLALLCICRWPFGSGYPLKYFDAEYFLGGVGAVALALMNSRLHREKPVLLEDSGYSHDPDEARTQVLLAWMKILQIKDANFVVALMASGFGETWTSFVNKSLHGFYEAGFNRMDQAVLFKRTRAICTSLSPSAKAVVDYFVTKALSRFKRI